MSFDHQGSVLAIGLVLVAASETRVVAEPLIAVEPAHVMRVSAMALRTSPCLKSAARGGPWKLIPGALDGQQFWADPVSSLIARA